MIRLPLGAALLAMASAAEASEGVAPTSEVLPATDVVVVGALHDVTVARACSSPASGTK